MKDPREPRPLGDRDLKSRRVFAQEGSYDLALISLVRKSTSSVSAMGLGITLIVNDPLLVYYFFIFPLTVIVPLWLAIKFPTFRVGVGFVTFVLSIVVLYIQLTMETTLGFVVTSGFFGTVFGFCLMAWGIATRAPAEEIKAQEVARVCPKCGKNLSSFPDDIQLCPYCGNQLA